jgi:ketosteroid isomerase-like protein
LGRYVGTRKATGKAMNPQVAHLWTIAEDKVSAFQQIVDTVAVAQAINLV